MVFRLFKKHKPTLYPATINKSNWWTRLFTKKKKSRKTITLREYLLLEDQDYENVQDEY